MEPEPGLLAEYFDGWYADMTRSPAMDKIQQRHLGLPPHLLSTSLLGWDGIAEADAVLCVDAIQFAQEPDAAYREIQRVLTSAGRAVLTCWEPLDRDDERLPGRLRRVDLGAGLAAAGFGNVEVRDRPGWRACERAMWEEAAALDPVTPRNYTGTSLYRHDHCPAAHGVPAPRGRV